MARKKFIVNVCPTGMVPTKAHNPHVPMTPEELAEDLAGCVALGASMLHLHARDEDGVPDWRAERFTDIFTAVRRRCPDEVIIATTSGRNVKEVERRGASLDATPRPDMASLTLSSLNFLRQGSLNPPDVIQGLAAAMYERGIVPELEVFDVGMARYARFLVDKGVLEPPFYVNILLGNVATAGCDPMDLAAIVHSLPEGCTWCVAGIGREQLRANMLGILFGHGARVGLEDNIYLEGKELATNQALVRRVVEVADRLGYEPMSAAEVRERLQMGPAVPVPSGTV